MNNYELVQKEVQEAIAWEACLSAAEIKVTTNEGKVTLTGRVDNYALKVVAECVVKGIKGVKSVEENLEVILGNWSKKTDSDILEVIVSSFMWNANISSEKVKVKVENGWVTLTGELNWNYQKKAIDLAVSNLIGVMGITNELSIKSEQENVVEQGAIDRAMARTVCLENEAIQVNVEGSTVVLSGTVTSWIKKEEAERVVWNAPGVESVDNQLVVS